MTPSNAYEKARKQFMLMRSGSGWSVLIWRPGLHCWDRLQPVFTRSEAVAQRASLVASYALLLLGLNESQVARLLAEHHVGPVRDRIRAAYREFTLIG